MTPAELNRELSAKQIQRDKDMLYLAEHVDARCIAILEQKFSTRKACFLRSPSGYDPLDAMRRDAYREVVSFLKAARAKAVKLSQNQ